MEDKKLHILQNVCQLYQKYGIKSITMDDIANELAISKKTLYQYFNDKEELVSQVFDFFMESPIFNMNDKNYGNAIDRLFALREHVSFILKHFNNTFEFELKKYYPDLFKKWHEFRINKIYEDTFRNVSDGKKEGLFRSDVDADFVARLQVGRMLFSLNPDLKVFTEQQLMSMELFDNVMDYHLHAICTAEGLAYYHKIFKNIYKNE